MRPIPLSVGVGVVVVAFAAVVAFLCLATYERKAHVSGLLVDDRAANRVSAPESGPAVESTVREVPSLLQAQLFVPSGVVGYMQAGQPVLLRYQAFAYAKYGHQTGQVVRVTRTPLQASELAALPLTGLAHKPADAMGEPLYRVAVALDQQSVRAYDQAERQPLAAGMQVEADVGLERRRLIEWMFEPLLGLAGRLSPAQP